MGKNSAGKYRLKVGRTGKKVIGAYQKIEDAVVGRYKKIETSFTNAFLEKVEESGEENETENTAEK